MGNRSSRFRSKDGNKYEKAKGRDGTGLVRFANLPHKLLKSDAYRALTPNDRALLVELAMMYNGANNGTGLFLSVRDAADRMGVADPTTAGRSFDRLEALGFIICTSEAHFAVKCGNGSRARFWRLTWEPVAGKRGPTHDYLEREAAPKTPERKRMVRGQEALKRWTREAAQNKISVGDFPTQPAERVGKKHTTPLPDGAENETSVRDFPTRFAEKGGKPPIVVVGDSPTYTSDQYGADADPSENQQGETPLKKSGGPILAVVEGGKRGAAA
jgi:hypothetical protein